MKFNISDKPVMKSCCKTCPFKMNRMGEWQNFEIANIVIERNLFKSQQVCRGTEGENREINNRCKGYFDYAYEIYHRMGIEPKKNTIY